MVMLRRAFSISLFILAICLLAPHANAQIHLGTLTLQGSDPIPCSQATGVHAWLCAGYATINGVYQCTAPKCPNNSAAQGNFFYEQFTSSADRTFQLTGIQNCVQEEGVDEGTDPDTGLSAITAIENDMENHCVSN